MNGNRIKEGLSFGPPECWSVFGTLLAGRVYLEIYQRINKRVFLNLRCCKELVQGCTQAPSRTGIGL